MDSASNSRASTAKSSLFQRLLLRPSVPDALRSPLARDVAIALLVKLVLLTVLIQTISHLVARAPNSAADTAAAVAGNAAQAVAGQ